MVDVGVADVAGHQRPLPGGLSRGLGGDLMRKPQGASVQRLKELFLADEPKLLPVPVIRKCLDDVRARVDELPIKLLESFRVVEHYFGDEGTRLQIATPLQLKQIALGADDAIVLEAVKEPACARGGHGDCGI